jgi:hypothetical protein
MALNAPHTRGYDEVVRFDNANHQGSATSKKEGG